MMLGVTALAAMALATFQGGQFNYVAFVLVTATSPFLILFAVVVAGKA